MSIVILEISDSMLSFGCMRARDLNDHPVLIILYEYIHCMYLPIVPQKGDFILCEHYHHHVYIPLRLIIREHLVLRKLPVPNDVVAHYFPMFRKFKH